MGDGARLGRPDGEREADVTAGDRLLHAEEEVGPVRWEGERGPTGADFLQIRYILKRFPPQAG